jgi:hypothetical protein
MGDLRLVVEAPRAWPSVAGVFGTKVRLFAEIWFIVLTNPSRCAVTVRYLIYFLIYKVP